MKHIHIIDQWPSVGEFAADIGVEPGTAKAMRWRGRIPEQYWVLVEDAGLRRGIPGATLPNLAAGAAEKAGIRVPDRYLA